MTREQKKVTDDLDTNAQRIAALTPTLPALPAGREMKMVEGAKGVKDAAQDGIKKTGKYIVPPLGSYVVSFNPSNHRWNAEMTD